tara:strand:- start:515 stop:760 length:246 start_codon:yes stop_codon:yes gene_type:complete
MQINKIMGTTIHGWDELYEDTIECYRTIDTNRLKRMYWKFYNFKNGGVRCEVSRKNYSLKCKAIKSILKGRLEWCAATIKR